MSSLRTKISRRAFFDGAGLIFMGALSLVIFHRDLTNLSVGMALVTLGGIELRGRQFLGMGNARATGWLVASQLALLGVIVIYCLRNLWFPPSLRMGDLPPEMMASLQNLPGGELDLDAMVPDLVRIIYSALILVSVLYQGSMALFYWKNTPKALAAPPPLPTIA